MAKIKFAAGSHDTTQQVGTCRKSGLQGSGTRVYTRKYSTYLLEPNTICSTRSQSRQGSQGHRQTEARLQKHCIQRHNMT